MAGIIESLYVLWEVRVRFDELYLLILLTIGYQRVVNKMSVMQFVDNFCYGDLIEIYYQLRYINKPRINKIEKNQPH